MRYPDGRGNNGPAGHEVPVCHVVGTAMVILPALSTLPLLVIVVLLQISSIEARLGSWNDTSNSVGAGKTGDMARQAVVTAPGSVLKVE